MDLFLTRENLALIACDALALGFMGRDIHVLLQVLTGPPIHRLLNYLNPNKEYFQMGSLLLSGQWARL